MRGCIRIVVRALGALAVCAFILAGLVVYFGWYDVSATRPHTPPIHRLLDIALARSVAVRADQIQVPPLDAETRIQNGFELFRAHCVQCHGAPGTAPAPYALGLNPAPASLVASARDRPAAEIYWIVREGIKMTGMPAWKYRLTDTQMWDVVAFMRVLPALSPVAYRQWDEKPARLSPRAASQDPTATGDSRIGDVTAGRQAVEQYLCATCHVIPDVVGASHHVGPPLAGIAQRPFIAGVLSNNPENMRLWLMAPTTIKPGTAMPDLGISGQDARDIAAFLTTLSESP
ncbi:c-type cytochrome [Bordetella muralis]|uniref:c-type cytochrome n=1 Tax=Bordetella muralis TaxID=1649130 RepID=UPI0039EF1A69